MSKSSVVCALLALCVFSVSASAADITLFGGLQHQGQLTFQSAPGSASNFVSTFNPKNFGVFGGRLSAGKIIGSENTIAYAPNFIQSGNSALILHTNLLLQLPTPVVKPYGTVGVGIIHSGGVLSLGTKLAINYGGGIKAMAGPVGLALDLRGYRVPKITIAGYTGQQPLNFIQVTAGVVFKF